MPKNPVKPNQSMGQATVPTNIEPLNLQPYSLESIEPMDLPEATYPLHYLEPMKVGETKVNMAPQEMAEETAEATNEEKPTALFGTLEGIDPEEIPQLDL